LDAIAQSDIDHWLTDRAAAPLRRCRIPHLTARHQLTGEQAVPQRRNRGTGRYLDDDQHTEQLQRGIHDTDIPLDVRISGALALLFGVAMPSIARITTDDVHQRDRDLYLTIGDKSVQLPPALADKLNRHGITASTVAGLMAAAAR
jgi:hypothetical protein